MKIVFLGTPGFAVPSLEILVRQGYEIAAVITAPDKKAGRGLKIKETAVKEYAVSAGLKVMQPEKLSDPCFLQELRNFHADLFIVVAFRMLPEAVWQMPPLGTFNLHSSLLPQYRGAAPVNRVIMNGEKETGITTFFLKHEIDTGDILFREKVSIAPDETAGELHDRLMIAGADLVLKTVKAIENGTAHEIPQQQLLQHGETLKTAPKIFNNDCRISWDRPALNIHNQIRGLSPFPGAFTWLKDATGNLILLKIFRSKISGKSASGKPGSVSSIQDRLFITCADEQLELLEVQQEGKKRIAVADFLRGFRVEKEWIATDSN